VKAVYPLLQLVRDDGVTAMVMTGMRHSATGWLFAGAVNVLLVLSSEYRQGHPECRQWRTPTTAR
jgi:hypothetical protein